MREIVCPECGGPLLFEELGSYGRIHRISKDGTIAKRARTQLYALEGIDSAFVYCVRCGDNKKFRYMMENGKSKIELKILGW